MKTFSVTFHSDSILSPEDKDFLYEFLLHHVMDFVPPDLILHDFFEFDNHCEAIIEELSENLIDVFVQNLRSYLPYDIKIKEIKK